MCNKREREKEFFFLLTTRSSLWERNKAREKERRAVHRKLVFFSFLNGYKLTYNRVRIPNIIYT
jgi:hypothetical protein